MSDTDRPDGDMRAAPPQPSRAGRFALRLMQVSWPAFLGAAAACGVFFSVVDPTEVALVKRYLGGDPLGAYTVGFLAFWALFMLTGGLTMFMISTERHAAARSDQQA
ncbi:MAG: hypothetical protein R3E83_13390 [Burkholderiaceae bacterium]